MSDDDTKQDDQVTSDVEPTEGVETDESIEAGADSTEADTSRVSDRSWPSRLPHLPQLRRLGAIPVIPLALVLGLLAAGGLAAWVYFSQYRPDRRPTTRCNQSAVNAARDGTVALLSYKPDTLESGLRGGQIPPQW